MPELHLRAVEDPPSPPRELGNNGRNGGGNLDSRVAALETHLGYLATKTDVQGLKTWVLGGVVGGIIVAVILTLAAVRLFLSVSGPPL